MEYLVGLFVGLACGIAAALLLFAGTVRIVCITDGATLNHKTTKDQKYLTYYCIKNGKVVP